MSKFTLQMVAAWMGVVVLENKRRKGTQVHLEVELTRPVDAMLGL